MDNVDVLMAMMLKVKQLAFLLQIYNLMLCMLLSVSLMKSVRFTDLSSSGRRAGSASVVTSGCAEPGLGCSNSHLSSLIPQTQPRAATGHSTDPLKLRDPDTI